MFKHLHCIDYELDAKNSSPAKAASFNHPAEEGCVCFYIYEVAIEAKISELKKLKIGDEINFGIEQELFYEVWKNRKNPECELSYLACGQASGSILDTEKNREELSFDGYEDDEYIEIVLRIDGYAENV